MNSLVRILFVFCLFGAGPTLAAETVRVAGSRELHLAIVDTAKASAARDATHAAFAASFGEAVSKLYGSTIGVRAKCVNPDHAAFNLGTGVYDAVLVLGGSLPRALMISDISRLSATLGAGKAEKKVYLIFGNGDATLSSLLAGSFASALTSAKFLDTLDGVGVEGKLASSGAKVAASP
jgi:hypothetical protein